MAKFWNIDKRRDPRTGKKISRLVKRSDYFGGGLEKYYSAHPVTTAQQAVAQERGINEIFSAAADDGDVQPLGGTSIAGELWMKYFTFVFSRLRQWLGGLWTASRFTHPMAWLMESRHQSRP